jgi:plastocyanin
VHVPARRAALLAAVAMIAIPVTAAQAKTKTVDMGLPTKVQGEFQNKYSADVNDFFPHKVTIRSGDKVRFRPVGFHTVDVPPDGGSPLPLITPQGQISGVVDANNAAFWFNGQANQQFNPALLQSGFGKSFTRQGNARVSSGLPLAPNPEPMTVKFKKRGSYTYFCDVHPGMKGTVVVKKKGAKVPTAKQDRKRVKKQIATARKRAKKLKNLKPPAGTVYTGGSAKGGVEFFGMLPASTTVPVGTTLRFAMSPRSYEVHTATFGPEAYVTPISNSFAQPPLDQRGVYPSEQPPSVGTLTPALHGNGFWNSGVLDASGATPLPSSASVTFGAKGTYAFICAIHPFMQGQVIVQ